MTTTWTVLSWLCIAGAFALFLAGMIAWGRRTDQRNYGYAAARAHVESLRDFLPSDVVEAAIYETAVDAAMTAASDAR